MKCPKCKRKMERLTDSEYNLRGNVLEIVYICEKCKIFVEQEFNQVYK